MTRSTLEPRAQVWNQVKDEDKRHVERHALCRPNTASQTSRGADRSRRMYVLMLVYQQSA